MTAPTKSIAYRGTLLTSLEPSALHHRHVPDATGHLAVTKAVREARWRETDVVVVNAVDSVGYTRPTAAEELDLDALAARLDAEGVPHSIRHLDIGSGTASHAVLGVAEEVGAELLVVGLHRRSPVGKALLGSNAQQILLNAGCPVLAVRADDPTDAGRS